MESVGQEEARGGGLQQQTDHCLGTAVKCTNKTNPIEMGELLHPKKGVDD